MVVKRESTPSIGATKDGFPLDCHFLKTSAEFEGTCLNHESILKLWINLTFTGRSLNTKKSPSRFLENSKLNLVSNKCEKRFPTLKPVFHWKSHLCWLPSTNEIDANNTKCTCPMPAPPIWDPTPPIFHLLALRVGKF